MSQQNLSLKSRLKRAELLEPRTVLSGTAVVQPFSNAATEAGTGGAWSLDAIEANQVWDQGFTGEDIVVAVIDTGVDVYHEDLVHNIWINEGEIPGNDIDDDNNGFVDDVHGWDFVDFDGELSDDSGHGTAVAGTIVAARNDMGPTGIAYDATVMVVRVLDGDGIGTQLDIAAGIRYAIANGADVINLSLGGTDSRRIETAIEYARTEDILVVAASGNAATNAPDFPARYSAELDNVISVGAYNSNFELAEFSNLVGNTNSVQVDAPGTSIASTVPDNGYKRVSGTSFAAPHVTGVAALALSANPDLTAVELRDIIVRGATHQISDSDSLGGLNAATTIAFAGATQPTIDVAPSDGSPTNPPADEPPTESDPDSNESVSDSSESNIENLGDESVDDSSVTPKPLPVDNEITTPGAEQDSLGNESLDEAPTSEDVSSPTGSPTLVEDKALTEATPADDAPSDGSVTAAPPTDGTEHDSTDPLNNAVSEQDAEQAASLLAYLGDIDGDGEVGFDDFLTFARSFGEAVDLGSAGDLNRDGVVGFDDFLTFSRNFGRTLDEVFAEQQADVLSESATDELFDQE